MSSTVLDGLEHGVRTDAPVAAAIPAFVVEMIDASALADRVELAHVGEAFQARRRCLALRGTVRDPNDIYVWPADLYEIRLDAEVGVLLRLEARFGGVSVAKAEFSRVEYNVETSPDMFRRVDHLMNPF